MAMSLTAVPHPEDPMKALAPVPLINVPIGFDLMAEEGEPTTTHVTAGARNIVYKVRTTAKVKALVEAQGTMFEGMHPPLTAAHSYTNSRLLVMSTPDGNKIATVLALLATVKYDAWDYKKTTPVWKDRDWTNESLENVILQDLYPVNKSATPKQSAYGVPAGTPEYFKRYRKANPEKWNQYQKNYRERRKEELKNARAAKQSPEADQPHGRDLSSKLDDILKDLNMPKEGA